MAMIGLVTLTAGAIVVNSYLATQRHARLATELLARANLDLAHERVSAYLGRARDAVLVARRVFAGVPLDPLAPEPFERQFFQVVGTHAQLSMMAVADDGGNFVMVQRQADGSLDTKIVTRTGAAPMGQAPVGSAPTANSDDDAPTVRWHDRPPGEATLSGHTVRLDPNDSFDPRSRPWFVGALAANGLFLTGVYVFHTQQTPGITISIPLKLPNGRQGVICADVRLADLSQFIETIEVGRSGQALIVDGKGRLVAAPPRSMGKTLLAPLTESDSAEVRALATIQDESTFSNEATLRSIEVSGEMHTLGFLSIELADTAAEVPWAVAVDVPEADLTRPFEESATRSLVLSLLLLLIAVIVALLLTRRITRSFGLLAKETREIAQLHFDEAPRFRGTFREVEDVLAAFDQMKLGLRAFQKYLPLKLVRKLLAEQTEPRLGGEFVELTIFFSDVANFTTLTEKTHPMAMAERLGRYLGEMTAIIEDHEGTVIQYVGDEVMAIWGAPTKVADHAFQALAAALPCAARTNGDATNEALPFITRFGIHSAQVAVGHFGSNDRLYYGAIGDGINVASRLEGACKQYRVSVMVSEDTVRGTDKHFAFRKIDRVVLKGRQEPLDIYEPIGAAVVATPEWAHIYQAALDRYFLHDFAGAERGFRKVLEIRPSDGPASVLAPRCAEFVIHPPLDSWDGAWVMAMK